METTMRHIETSATIAASAARIWEVLPVSEENADWNANPSMASSSRS